MFCDKTSATRPHPFGSERIRLSQSRRVYVSLIRVAEELPQDKPLEIWNNGTFGPGRVSLKFLFRERESPRFSSGPTGSRRRHAARTFRTASGFHSGFRREETSHLLLRPIFPPPLRASSIFSRVLIASYGVATYRVNLWSFSGSEADREHKC